MRDASLRQNKYVEKCTLYLNKHLSSSTFWSKHSLCYRKAQFASFKMQSWLIYPQVISNVKLLKKIMFFAMLVSAVPLNKAFTISPSCRNYQRMKNTFLAAETVEVCGFKDCRRAGGGARLQKLVTEVCNGFLI